MSTQQEDKNWADLRNAVFVRDQHQCTCCLGRVEEVKTHDPDHNVPRGVGGSDRLSNLSTLCRQCHDAKHGEGIAPTVQLESSGDMSSIEFQWFKQLMNHIIPALSREFQVRLQPKFGLDDDTLWYLPLGDLRRLDEQLLEADIEYCSLRPEQYM